MKNLYELINATTTIVKKGDKFDEKVGNNLKALKQMAGQVRCSSVMRR